MIKWDFMPTIEKTRDNMIEAIFLCVLSIKL